MSKKAGKNARSVYRQQLLSGWSDFGKPENWHSGSTQEVKRSDKEPQGFTRKQAAYQISIPVVLEKVSFDGDNLKYTIRIDDDTDLLISTYSKRSKKATQPAITIPKTGIKGSVSVPMVYGIHESGNYSLSHTANSEAVKLSSAIYSYLLGQVDRAIEFTILQLEEQAGNDDARERGESPQSPKNLGTYPQAGRSKTLRAQVLPEALPKKGSSLDETDR